MFVYQQHLEADKTFLHTYSHCTSYDLHKSNKYCCKCFFGRFTHLFHVVQTSSDYWQGYESTLHQSMIVDSVVWGVWPAAVRQARLVSPSLHTCCGLHIHRAAVTRAPSMVSRDTHIRACTTLTEPATSTTATHTGSSRGCTGGKSNRLW